MKKSKFLSFIFFAIILQCVHGQQRVENIIIVTTDGFRWQEVFGGMDSTIAHQKKFNQGSDSYIFATYWNNDATIRRQRLLPFIWNTVAKNGQIYGNRNFGNKVDNANPYWFSYPGYSEIFCGFADTLVNSNSYIHNPNTNVLEFINKQQGYKNKVAAFGAWDAFDKILNEPRSNLPVICGFDSCGGRRPNDNERLINQMLNDSYKPFGYDECLDVFTQYEAMEYLKTKKPKVLYISYGETDEWAHAGQYRDYLNAGHQFDKWLSDIWNHIQNTPRYKNKTALFITVDHGRGDQDKNQWTDHGQSVPDSHEIWFAVMGPGIPAKGEVKSKMQIYQNQFAQTIASLLGLKFTAEHPVADEVNEIK